MPGGYKAPINVRDIDQQIKDKGIWVDWYRTQRCPCLDDNGYASSLCPICFGIGWLSNDPVRLKGLLVGHTRRGSREASGLIDTGTRSFTPPRNVRLAEGDWIRVRQFPMRDSQVLVYGAPMGEDDRLNVLFPKGILSVKSIRNGTLHVFDPAAYTNATDPDNPIQVGPDGALQWQDTGSDRPFPGEKYSVEYDYYEAYAVTRGEMPMQRGTENKRLPDRATVKLITRRSLRATPTPTAIPDEDF